MPGGGFDPYTDEPGDILYGPSDQFGLTAWSSTDIIKWRWYGDFSPGHTVKTRSIQNVARKRLAQLQLRVRLGAESNLGMGRHVWHEADGVVITAITRPGHDEIWIEASVGAKEEEEKKEEYIPSLWIGVRIVPDTAQCPQPEGTAETEVRLWIWEPPDSAPQSARDRTQGPGKTRAGVTTQHVGAMFDVTTIACNIGMGTKPGGDSGALEGGKPPGSPGVGSVPMTRFINLTNCDDQEITLLDPNVPLGGGLFADGIYVPTCCLPITPANGGSCGVWIPFCFSQPGTVREDIQDAEGAVDPNSDVGLNILHFSSYGVQYTDSGLVYLQFPYAYDPLQDPDNPDPDSMWGEVAYIDPEDTVHKFEETLPFQFYGGQVTGRFNTLGRNPSAVVPSWQLKGIPLPGRYVVKCNLIGYPCCAPFPFGKGGGGATIELEVRLGKEGGRQVTQRFEFEINGQTGLFRNMAPYGFFVGTVEDPRDTDNSSSDFGPCNPNDENNWWRDALIIDVVGGGIAIEEEYWLDGKLEGDEFYQIETFPGVVDTPFDINSDNGDFCGTCDLQCIDPPLACVTGCSDFHFLPVGGIFYPAHVIFHRAILICIEPADGNCRIDENPFTGEPDPYLGRNKPTRIQIVNNCSTGANQVAQCEPLGQGSTHNVATDISIWSTFTAEHEWQLGDVVYVAATTANNVFIVPENAPEIASPLFLNTLICPSVSADGTPLATRDGGPHGQFLESLGIDETKCLNGAEVVTKYLGVAV